MESFFQIMWPPHNILTLQVRLHLRRKNTLKKYEECHWGVIDKTTIVHFISNQFVARSHIFIKFIQIISVSGLILKSVKWMQGIGNGNQIRIKKRRWNFQGFVNSRLSRLQAETWANIINESSGTLPWNLNGSSSFCKGPRTCKVSKSADPPGPCTFRLY